LDQPAVDDDVVIIGASEDGAIGAVDDDVVIIGASDDGAIGAADTALEAADDAADSIAETADDSAEDAADETAEVTASELLTATELVAVLTAVGLLLRLKIQIRPMMTITATMMIIQVLRFMGRTLVCLSGPGRLVDHARRLAASLNSTASIVSSVIGGI
jgi:hypothetical protein